jgi:uncharacterized membrane protein (DUF2068 family)
VTDSVTDSAPSSEPPPRPRGITKKLKKAVEAPDFGLKVIVAWKLLKGALLLVVAIGAFTFIHKDVHERAVNLVTWLHLDPTSHRLAPVLDKLGKFETPLLKFEVGTGALVFAAFIFVEGYGLWRRRVWAEVLTIAATSLLIPVEVYEICKHPSVGKVLTLLVNFLIVLYLARHHYLFVPGPIGRWLHANFGKERHA